VKAVLDAASLVAGIAIVVYALQTAIQTFLLPQPGLSLLSRVVFRSLQPLVHSIERAPLPPARRHALLSIYAPLCLLLIVFGTIVVIGLGYTLVLYGLGAPTLEAAFLISISSVSTLGFAPMGDGVVIPLAATIETMIGVLIVALLIGYLPTIYGAVQEREHAVATLAMHVGTPPTGVSILSRYAGADGASRFESLMNDWSGWFVALAESHNALAGIVFARSPQPQRSWVTTGGAVLDAAALALTALDPPLAAGAEPCLTAGSQALSQILEGVHLQPADHHRNASALHVTPADFDAACAMFAAAGLPLAADRAAAWSAFAKLRGEYDAPLVALCRLTRAPSAPWSSAHPAARLPLMLPLWRGRKHAAPTMTADS
jgi:hypothetical protein